MCMCMETKTKSDLKFFMLSYPAIDMYGRQPQLILSSRLYLIWWNSAMYIQNMAPFIPLLNLYNRIWKHKNNYICWQYNQEQRNTITRGWI